MQFFIDTTLIYRVLLFLGLAFVGFNPLACLAYAEQPAINVETVTATSLSLTEHFAILEDTSASLVLADMERPQVAARFVPSPGPGSDLSYGYSRSAYWLRLKVANSGAKPLERLLELDYARLGSVQFYLTGVDGLQKSIVTGNALPFATRGYKNRFFVFPFVLAPQSEQLIYLRIASKGPILIPAHLWAPQAFYVHERADYLAQAWYFGMATSMILFNLLLFLALRDVIYLWYVSFVTCLSLALSAQNGLLKEYLWFELSPGASTNASFVGYSFSLAVLLCFMRRMLVTQVVVPRIDRIFVYLAGIFFLSPIAFMVSYETVVRPTAALYAGASMLILGVSIYCAFQRQRSAYFFVAAFAMMLLGAIMSVMRAFGLMETNVITTNGLQYGSALEMVLLAFALADRINVARREKEIAQTQMLSEQAMVRALQQSQDRYSAVIEHVAEGMVVLKDNRIVFVNSRATEILEQSKEEIVAAGGFDRIHADDVVLLRERVSRRLAGLSVPERCEVRLDIPGQTRKWLELGDNLVPWDAGQGLLIFFLDVTQRHTAEAEIRTALERQQDLNAMRSRIVAMTSHEFRTPLSTILSSRDLLEHYGDRLAAPEKIDILGSIATAVHRMTHMLDRVLLLGKAEAKMLEFKPQDLDLKALLEVLMEEARVQQSNTSCLMKLEFQAPTVRGMFDEKLLRHIFGNLLSNAIKYSPTGGTVCVRVSEHAGRMVCEVSDQGIGIPAEDIADLFESFHRASNVGAIAGTGLGLAIVKQSVELHGGSIAVRSPPGQGTTFSVTL